MVRSIRFAWVWGVGAVLHGLVPLDYHGLLFLPRRVVDLGLLG